MRTTIRKILCLVLVGALLLSCGCSAGGSGETSQTDMSEYDTLIFPLIVSGKAPENLPQVQRCLNEYVMDKIGAAVQLVPVDIGSMEKYYLLRGNSDSAPDFINLLPAGPGLSIFVGAGMLLPLDDLLTEYGRGITEATADILETGRLNGVQYMIPGVADTCAMGTSVEFSAALVEKYGFDITTIRSITDLEPMLKIIHTQEPDIVPITSYPSGYMGLLSNCDNLTDSLGVLNLNADDSLTVVNWYETEEFWTLARLTRDWYLKGYIPQDALVAHPSTVSQLQQGNAFCTLSTIMPMGDQGTNLDNPSRIVEIQLSDISQLQTSYDAGLQCVGISSECRYPEKAMRFLELLYTDQYVVDLLQYGLEGEDYIIAENGLIDTGGQRFLLYGQTMNMPLRTPTIEEGVDYKQKCDDFNSQNIISPAFGFVFDATSVAKETALCKAVVEKYFPLINCGCIDPETEIPKLILELKDAGIDVIIAEKQRQLDVWAGQNNRI